MMQIDWNETDYVKTEQLNSSKVQRERSEWHRAESRRQTDANVTSR